MSLKGGDIVRVSGPYPASVHDLTVFRRDMINDLLPGEMVEADAGYRGESTKIRTPKDYVTGHERTQKQRAHSRHETCNKRLKQFGILKNVFRHPLRDHRMYF